VLCWGSDDDGELGNGPAAGPGPVTAILPAPAVDVDASDTNVCAALETGEVYCWGENDVGQTNPLTPMARRYDTPVRVDGISGAVRVACGGIHCCSQSEDGELLCWGSNDTLGLTSSVPVGSDFLPPTFATGSCR
jgi:alpha-tubulin suppressor-like RCC1 family protein